MYAVIVPVILPSYLLALRRVTGVRLRALGRAGLLPLLASSAAALAAWAAASQLNNPLSQLVVGLAAGGAVYIVGAGPQAIAVFGHGRAAARIGDFYGAAARLIGKPAGGRGKHAAPAAKPGAWPKRYGSAK